MVGLLYVGLVVDWLDDGRIDGWMDEWMDDAFMPHSAGGLRSVSVPLRQWSRAVSLCPERRRQPQTSPPSPTGGKRPTDHSSSITPSNLRLNQNVLHPAGAPDTEDGRGVRGGRRLPDRLRAAAEEGEREGAATGRG